jgi:type I restriction enzyme S subunit
MCAKGQEPRDDRWKTRYKHPAAPDTSNLPNLPEGWVWASLDALALITGGVTVDQKRQPENPVVVPYLRVANVQRGFLDLSEIKEITVEAATAENLRLMPGDILFTEGGDRDKLGRGWTWNDELPFCIHQNHIFRARLYSSAFYPEFVSHFANVMGARYFSEQGKQTTNLASVSLNKLKLFPVPIPPKAEFPEIIDAIEGHLSVVDRFQVELNLNASRSGQMRQSILTAAFSGKLVPQDRNEEPASELLARIRSDGDREQEKTPRAKPAPLPASIAPSAAAFTKQTSLFD